MQVVGFDARLIAEESGDLVYLLAFPDQHAQEQARGICADPDWQTGKAPAKRTGVDAQDHVNLPAADRLFFALRKNNLEHHST
jgi:hypothetical protein